MSDEIPPSFKPSSTDTDERELMTLGTVESKLIVTDEFENKESVGNVEPSTPQENKKRIIRAQAQRSKVAKTSENDERGKFVNEKASFLKMKEDVLTKATDFLKTTQKYIMIGKNITKV